MPDYPRPCPKCGVSTEEEGFAVDRHAAGGRKSQCKACDRRRRKAYYAEHRDELHAQRQAARDAVWQAELEGRVDKHKKRVAAAQKQHEAAKRAQAKLLREIGYWESPYAQRAKREGARHDP